MKIFEFNKYFPDEAACRRRFRVWRDNLLIIRFTGNGFMKYQVRNMVGTLIKIGSNKFDVDIIDKILNDKSYKKYVYTAKAYGLYLESIEY